MYAFFNDHPWTLTIIFKYYTLGACLQTACTFCIVAMRFTAIVLPTRHAVIWRYMALNVAVAMAPFIVLHAVPVSDDADGVDDVAVEGVQSEVHLRPGDGRVAAEREWVGILAV